MQPKILFVNSIIGVIGVITSIQAVPIEVIYSGDTCDCPKKLNYELYMPLPPPMPPMQNVPNEHGYQVECPMKTKAKITYSFDFDAEEPEPKLTLPESKLNIFAKVDRMTVPKKDCYETEEVPRSCGCYRCALRRRYVLPQSNAARVTRNSRHPNSLDNIESSSSMARADTQIMAIYLKPLKQPIWDVSRKRNKRDISRIFTRPKKTEKRSDRVVKQYNKHLKDIAASEKRYFDEAENPIRPRAVAAAPNNGFRPLRRLSSLLALPNLRHKRDIKGEYDLIEKERVQMDLTLPEIIQYLPETLDPNFKRNQCNFGQSCHQTSTTEIINAANDETTDTTLSTTESENNSESGTTNEALNATEANNLKDEDREERQTDNDVINSMHKKRNAVEYAQHGCPLAINAQSPIPNPSFTYEPITDFESLPRTFNPSNNPYALDPIPQQYAGVPYNPYAPTNINNNTPLLGATYPKSAISQISNGQLDEFISAIIQKHADFLESSVQGNKDFIESPGEQELEAKYFLKSLAAGSLADGSFFNENQQQRRHYYHHPTVQEPYTAYERPYSV